MSKIVTIILIIASAFLVSLSVVAILLNQNNTSLTTASRTTRTPTITTLHTFTLSPHNQNIKQGETNNVDIVLETQASSVDKPRLLQMEIAYDPQALLNVDITPGDFFTNPTVALKTINSNTGRISYALEKSATDTIKETKGIAARLTFLPNPLFTNRETSLVFLGKTIIRSTADTDILTATYGTKLYFASSSATPNQ